MPRPNYISRRSHAHLGSRFEGEIINSQQNSDRRVANPTLHSPLSSFRRPAPPLPRCRRWTSNRPAKGFVPRPAPLCTLTDPRSVRPGQEMPRPSKLRVGTLFLPSLGILHRCGLARWPSRTRRRASAWTRGTDKTLRASASRRTPRPRRNRWKTTSLIWTLPPQWTRSALGETRTCSNPFGTAVTA